MTSFTCIRQHSDASILVVCVRRFDSIHIIHVAAKQKCKNNRLSTNTATTSFSGKGDIFGENMIETKSDDRSTVGKSNYTVRPLSHCDINKITTEDLRDVLDTYSEFGGRFLKAFKVTFNFIISLYCNPCTCTITLVNRPTAFS